MTAIVFTEFERDPDVGVGVMFKDFITALGMWVYTNEGGHHRVLTVAEAAMTFNTTVEIIREAAKDHPWLFLSGDTDPAKQTIESDGE